MNCPVCNSEKTSTIFIKSEYPIIECKLCKHRFTSFNPSPEKISEMYSDDYFFKGGAGYADYTLEKNMLIKRGEYYATKISPFIQKGKLLDVGAAAGFILKGFRNKGWQGCGIEPNHSMVDYAKKELSVILDEGTLETMETEEKFDLVSMIQIMPHLSNLYTSLEKLFYFLTPKGYVLIETWNKDSLTAKFFGKYWYQYSPPTTLNYFSKKSLDILMNKNGFRLIKRSTPKKNINSTHAKSLLRHKLDELKALSWLKVFISLIPENIILPYPSEDLFWALYQKG